MDRGLRHANENLISQMLQASVQLYRNAFSNIPKPIWWLSLVMLVNRSGTMVIPFLTVYLTGNGYSLSQAGTVMAAFGVGAFLGGFLGGKLTDRFGFFQVQVGSLLLNGILFIVLGYMVGLVQITICVFVLSTLGEAFRPANAAAIGAYSSDSNRTRSYSLNRLAINLGWAIGPALGGVLATINYKLLFWVDGATCAIAALLLYLFLAAQVKKDKVETSSVTQPVTSSAYRDKIFLAGMFFILMIAFCFFQLFSVIPVFYKEQVHLNEAVIGLILAANGLLIGLVEMILVYKLEKLNRQTTFIVYGTLLIGVSFLILAIAPLLSLVLFSMVVITFGEMLLFPFSNDFWVSRTNNFNRGQYAGVYTMTFALAHISAPLLSSRMAVSLGFSKLFLIDFVICCIAALGFIGLKKYTDSHGKV
jgi:predicted MFS family arabinose efflux permease